MAIAMRPRPASRTALHVLTSESVAEGHPDKVCDFIADSILDAYLEQDPSARVACEVLCKAGNVVLAGEITSSARVDHEKIAREAIRSIGYVDPAEPFHADGVRVTQLISRQAQEIAQGVDIGGAGDQGLMFGYATDETDALMPLPILLAHALAARLASDRKTGRVPWLRPDAKTQVSVAYDSSGFPAEVRTVLVSTQHAPHVTQALIRDYVNADVIPSVLGEWYHEDLAILVNPTGSFVEGGPSTDCGVTGRKIIVDTYGGAARHGGGAFSGKDPSKVDRSGAYLGRYVARQVVREGLAHRCEVQVAYAIGRAKPVSVSVETFGTGNPLRAERFVSDNFDFRPNAIIERLDLRRPIYRGTTNYGHFGRAGLPWEE
jgi:S-adenosylmethionine synthetase